MSDQVECFYILLGASLIHNFGPEKNLRSTIDFIYSIGLDIDPRWINISPKSRISNNMFIVLVSHLVGNFYTLPGASLIHNFGTEKNRRSTIEFICSIGLDIDPRWTKISPKSRISNITFTVLVSDLVGNFYTLLGASFIRYFGPKKI